jgi:arylsulfatase A-like enzyme
MNRKRPSIFAGLICVMMCALLSPFHASGKPNIIYINADDLGWMDLSCQGSTYYETPNIDRLAKQGMRFTDAYAPAANCAPSRAACMSGMYTPRHGVYTVGSSERGKSKDRKLIPTKNTTMLDDSVVTMADALKAAGYATIHLGKWHVGKDPCTQGFDINIGGSHEGGPYRGKYISPYTYPNCEQEAAGEYLTDRLGTEAISFINAHQDKPFFMYLSTFAIHTPFEPKPEQLAHFEAKSGSDAHKNAMYAATIKALDENVGRVMDELDKLGLAENTLMLFTSDNGGVYKFSRQWPLRAGKGAYYEGGIREPLVVRWPGTIKAGSECSVPVIGIDFFPTFLDVADAPVPEGTVLDGVSLMPLLTGAESIKDRALYWHFPIYLQAGNSETRDPLFRTRPGSVIRYGDWKLHEYFEDGALELFNLNDDLGEKNNLAASHPEKVRELHEMLKAWHKEMDAPIPTELNPEYQP